MPSWMPLSLVLPLVLVIGLALGYFIRVAIARAMGQDAEKRRQQILNDARLEAEHTKKELEVLARQEIIEHREEIEKEVQETRRQLRQTERRLDKREDSLDKKQDLLSKKERTLETSEKNLAETRKQLTERENGVAELQRQQQEELYRISGLTPDGARQVLLERIKDDVEKDCLDMFNKKMAQANETAETKARALIVDALQRCAAECTSEATVCSVELPNDDIKGRIIGREGRNIRSFEKVTGVDVIVDDTPGVIVLSSFDSVRREAARLAMERLISDGRIHPGRIEEVSEKAVQDVQRMIIETGKDACYEMGLSAIPDQLKDLLGRLKFRTSFGQNVLQHSIEVGKLAALMASELHLNAQLAKRCGLLHDIGKALDQEHEGSHARLGAEQARRWGEGEQVINAIEAHHEETEATSPYAGLVIAADTMSASRPGARRETLERYIKRLERLETLAARHDGVQRAFAIQAGREVRVMVNADKYSDKGCAKLARDIAREIEQELQYPGEIQVMVIRESRFAEVAR